MRHKDNVILYCFGPSESKMSPESKILRLVVGVDCLKVVCSYKGSSRPPYIGQWMRSVPRLLVDYDQ
jgi:hypothetical protein